jgi:predicted dehydrogenase
MKVGVIGAGSMGEKLIRSLYELGALYGIAENDPHRRYFLAEDYPDVPLFDDFHDLLKTPVTAVAIATPAETHYEVSKAALYADKDVFVEKPITLSSFDAEELVAIARVRGLILMAGHLLLYQPAIQQIKSFLQSGSLGEVYSLQQERLNLGGAKSLENALWSLGVHDVAAILFIIGTIPNKIVALGQQILQPGVEDDVHLHMRFPGNLQAHLHLSWLWPERRNALTIIGSKGMLRYDEVDQTVIFHQKGIDLSLCAWDEGGELIFQGDGDPLRLELSHFLSRIADRKPPLSDGGSSIEVIRTLQEATLQLEEQCEDFLYASQLA